MDLGFSGNLFTWHNKREKHTIIFSRLGCAMANHLWIKLYPSTYVNYLPIIGSDHAPVLMDTYIRKFHKCTNYRFEVMAS